MVGYNVDKWSVYLRAMFLDCGRKSEYTERTNADTGRTYKLHTKGPG